MARSDNKIQNKLFLAEGFSSLGVLASFYGAFVEEVVEDNFGLDNASFSASTTSLALLGRLLRDQVELSAQRRATKRFSGAGHCFVLNGMNF